MSTTTLTRIATPRMEPLRLVTSYGLLSGYAPTSLRRSGHKAKVAGGVALVDRPVLRSAVTGERRLRWLRRAGRRRRIAGQQILDIAIGRAIAQVPADRDSDRLPRGAEASKY
jgi:hypothetical protein